jgi:hypothetical protein
MIIAPPSAQASCWRLFGGGLSAEVHEHEGVGVCSYKVQGPDGKTLRQGVAPDLLAGLRGAMELMGRISNPGQKAAA